MPEQVFNFFAMLMLYVHVMTMLTIVLVFQRVESDQGQNEIRRWLDIEGASDTVFHDFPLLYLHTQLWVWSNVSGWGGNWSPHTVLSSGWTYFNQFLGVFLYMYLFGEMVNLLHNLDLSAAEFGARRDKINHFMQLRDVPAPMQLRVHTYLDQIWRLKHGVDEKQVLNELPHYLRHDLSWFLNQQFLEKIPMFFGADSSAILEVNQHLVANVAGTGEYLARYGEIGHELHFILDGEVHVRNQDGELDIVLFEGSISGEITIIFEIPSPFDAIVHSNTTLLTLTEEKFDSIIAKFPAFLARIDRRGLCVYGDRWKEWAKLANELDRDQAESDEDAGGVSSTITFQRKLASNTYRRAGPSGSFINEEHDSCKVGPLNSVSNSSRTGTDSPLVAAGPASPAPSTGNLPTAGIPSPRVPNASSFRRRFSNRHAGADLKHLSSEACSEETSTAGENGSGLDQTLPNQVQSQVSPPVPI